GLLVDVRTSDFGSTHPLAGIEFQRKYERAAFLHGGGKAPTTLWKDFPTSALGKALPPFVKDAIIEAMPFLGRRLRGFDHPKALMVGVESRSSSPIRIIRDRSLCSNFTGLYPGGEGAGYAGGIVSAAVDGIRIAEEIIKTEV
ncbi:MAG: NAD(FAD)-utilizing dehydrogenase, partial [Anaerovoracaceae bacterium]